MRDNSALRVRLFPVAVIVVLLAFLAVGTASNVRRNPQPQLVADGIPGQQVPAATSATSTESPGYPDMVRHALADLDALTLPNGATLAGWDGPWRFTWPRDSSFVAAARCSIGQHSEADKVLGFLTSVRPTAGRWAARYSVDGAQPEDGREDQLDGSGWVLWATWFCFATNTESPGSGAPSAGTGGVAMLQKYWPMVQESANQIVVELGRGGLPAPSPDYWEQPGAEVTLGTVAPLLAGLRSGIAIATALGRTAEVSSWQDALNRLSTATDRVFGPDYPRTPAATVGLFDPGSEPVEIDGGADAIITVLGPPFAPSREVTATAIERSRNVLTQPNGGVTPGEQKRADGAAWTPSTALFALSAAARGDRATAESLLTWLDTNRTPSGALPEKVNRDLHPAGEAPLGWTAALVILTTTALQHPLPTP